MFLLTDLTEEGYLQIKKDKEKLIRKIQEYQMIISEFDLALPFLSAIYEPKIIIRKVADRYYEGLSFIPVNGEKIRIRVQLNKEQSSKFIDNEDNELKELLEKMVIAEIQEQFPTHFPDSLNFNKDDEGKY
jgi:hypothetical protein